MILHGRGVHFAAVSSILVVKNAKGCPRMVRTLKPSDIGHRLNVFSWYLQAVFQPQQVASRGISIEGNGKYTSGCLNFRGTEQSDAGVHGHRAKDEQAGRDQAGPPVP